MTSAEKLALRLAAYVVIGVVLIWLLVLGIAWGQELFPGPTGPLVCDVGTYNRYPGSTAPVCIPDGQVPS